MEADRDGVVVVVGDTARERVDELMGAWQKRRPPDTERGHRTPARNGPGAAPEPHLARRSDGGHAAVTDPARHAPRQR